MSDMYLILRRRLEDVTQDWVGIDGEVLVAARKRKGLSREALAPMIGVVSKTVERYEKESRVPRQLVRRVAEVLELEIEEGSRPALRVEVPPLDHPEAIAAEVASLRLEVAKGFEDLQAQLDALTKLVARQAAPARRTAGQKNRAV